MFRLMFSTLALGSPKPEQFAYKNNIRKNGSKSLLIENLNSQIIVRRFSVDQGEVFFAR